jgi:hypothetical protein
MRRDQALKTLEETRDLLYLQADDGASAWFVSEVVGRLTAVLHALTAPVPRPEGPRPEKTIAAGLEKMGPVTDEWLAHAIQMRAFAVHALGADREMLAALLELRERRAAPRPSEAPAPPCPACGGVARWLDTTHADLGPGMRTCSVCDGTGRAPAPEREP